MRNFFVAGHCGPTHVVDVFNMTHTLVIMPSSWSVPSNPPACQRMHVKIIAQGVLGALSVQFQSMRTSNGTWCSSASYSRQHGRTCR